eukprot:5074064-Prymnesium_polylepis.2
MEARRDRLRDQPEQRHRGQLRHRRQRVRVREVDQALRVGVALVDARPRDRRDEVEQLGRLDARLGVRPRDQRRVLEPALLPVLLVLWGGAEVVRPFAHHLVRHGRPERVPQQRALPDAHLDHGVRDE